MSRKPTGSNALPASPSDAPDVEEMLRLGQACLVFIKFAGDEFKWEEWPAVRHQDGTPPSLFDSASRSTFAGLLPPRPDLGGSSWTRWNSILASSAGLGDWAGLKPFLSSDLEKLLADYRGLVPTPLKPHNAVFYGGGSPVESTKGAGARDTGNEDGSLPSSDDEARRTLLAAAAGGDGGIRDPLQKLDATVRADAIELLGGDAVLGRAVTGEETLVEALAAGLPAGVIGALRDAGYSPTVLEQVIAPRRTLRRRKAEKQRLTRTESDAAWRLAHVLALATHVLDSRKAALAWLSRPKAAIRNRTPIDLIETSVGTAYIERVLRSLDWGDVA